MFFQFELLAGYFDAKSPARRAGENEIGTTRDLAASSIERVRKLACEAATWLPFGENCGISKK